MNLLRRMLLFAMAILGGASCSQGEDLTKEEIEAVVTIGMSRKQAEAFFEEHDIGYAFTSREKADKYGSDFEWKAEDAVGYYGGLIHDVDVKWYFYKMRLIPISEGLHIRIEIDSQDRVSQVVVTSFYTGP